MAVADASFKIFIDSMSFGLIKLSGSGDPAIEGVPSRFLFGANGTPSTTINGSLLAFSEAPPRIRIVLPEPGAPPLDVICTPATFPAISCSGVVIDPLLKSFAVIAVTAPVRSFFLLVPYPITTISLSDEVTPDNETIIGLPEITGTSRVVKPTEEKISALTVEGTVILKLPSLVVCVAV